MHKSFLGRLFVLFGYVLKRSGDPGTHTHLLCTHFGSSHLGSKGASSFASSGGGMWDDGEGWTWRLRPPDGQGEPHQKKSLLKEGGGEGASEEDQPPQKRKKEEEKKDEKKDENPALKLSRGSAEPLGHTAPDVILGKPLAAKDCMEAAREHMDWTEDQKMNSVLPVAAVMGAREHAEETQQEQGSQHGSLSQSTLSLGGCSPSSPRS